MEDPGVSSGNSGGKDPGQRPERLARPYVGAGDVVSPAHAGDGGMSEWFPVAPLEQDTALLAAPAVAGEVRTSRTTGRHRPPVAALHRWFPAATGRHRSRRIGTTAGIAAAGITVLAVGAFLAWHSSPATVPAASCRPNGCGGTASQGLATAPARGSSSAGAGSAARTPVGGPATATQASSPVRDSSAPSSATAGSAAPAGTAAAISPGASAGHGASAGSGSTTGSGTPTDPAAATAPAAAAASQPPSPGASAPQLTPGSVISINATTACCTMYYIRHDDADDRVVITEITAGSSALDKADATWVVKAGLADSACISLESANDPGQYLRHSDFELYLEPSDGSAQFAQDATFCPQPGNSGQGYSFQSVNYPAKYIRHYNYVVYIASDGGSNPWDGNLSVWPEDTSWLVTQPWG
jgi:hypothetical protein